MGFLKVRSDRNGDLRYTACYLDLKGRERSAGTFSSKKRANKAWQEAELKLVEGRIGDPRRGRQTFQRYVEETWLPNHVIEASTRESYVYSIGKHILPWFGPLRMVEILPPEVREWITHLISAGVSPATIRHNKIILSAIFTTALNDQVTFLHPCRGVRTPTVPVKPRLIITPEQFDDIYDALPDDGTRLLVETDIESGVRWGELTELRFGDINFRTRIATISRAVVELNPKYHPDGLRFLVKQYPKDKDRRSMKFSRQLIAKIEGSADARGLGPDGLLFAMRDGPDDTQPALRLLPNRSDLGLTEPNEKGRQYRHATLSGYSAGGCRCRHCKDAYAIYRANRRARGKDSPRASRQRDTDGHIPRDWFRNQVWKPALAAAGIEQHVRVHDLRHAHASWLLAGGADLQVVKERLGHASIATTEKYLHTLPDADETALDALARIRRRG